MSNEFLNQITQATREQLVGSIALMGPSGAGKTLSALKIAKGMMDKKYGDSISEDEKWKKVGYVDTEHERSKIYANNSRHGIGAFSHIDFKKPYSLDRYDDAVIALKQHGCEVVITDSLSHFWEGDGGILDLQQSYGGTFQAWRDTNPHYSNFISLVTGERHGLDMINCIRAKQAYEVSTSETGKLKVEKLGLKPVQRDSLEYEFHIVFSIDMNHTAVTVKDNSEIFKDVPRVIDAEVGELIYDWLKTGKDIHAEREAALTAEREEKEAMFNNVKAFLESKTPGMKEYTEQMIAATQKKAGGSLVEKLNLEQLKRMLTTVHNKEQELKKVAETVEKDKQEIVEGVINGLRQVAKSFKIKGYTKMSKEELEEAIKKAQGEEKKETKTRDLKKQA